MPQFSSGNVRLKKWSDEFFELAMDGKDETWLLHQADAENILSVLNQWQDSLTPSKET